MCLSGRSRVAVAFLRARISACVSKRVLLPARSECVSSPSIDSLLHVARFPCVPDVRELLAMETVELEVVPQARDTSHAAYTERVAPRRGV